MAPVVVDIRPPLRSEQFESLRSTLLSHCSMERVLTWFYTHTPPLAPEDIVQQDEFSYDLLVPLGSGLYLSYDTN